MNPKIPIAIALLLTSHEPGRAAVDDLRRQAEIFAGQQISLDSRLNVPDCAGGYSLAWATSGRTSLAASCERSGWRMSLPVTATTAIRKGQMLRVETEGQGFRVGVDAIVESRSGSGGGFTVRNSRSGRSFAAFATADGRTTLPGVND